MTDFVLLIGITTVNNFDKMKSVQTSLENLSKSMENGQTEEDTKTTTAAEAKEGAKEVSGTVKKSEEAKVSKEEESQLTDKDYYVVQKVSGSGRMKAQVKSRNRMFNLEM